MTDPAETSPSRAQVRGAILRIIERKTMTPLVDIQRRLAVTEDGKWGPQTARAVAKALLIPSERAIVLDVALSPNFVLREFTTSATAKARGLSNMPNAAQLLALVAWCENIGEPVRAQFGPVRVTSGYRCFTPDSQHGAGEAADFEVPGVANITVARWIRDNLTFDQLILEAWKANDPNAGWVHCSYRRDRARKSVLRTPTGGAPYYAGLPS